MVNDLLANTWLHYLTDESIAKAKESYTEKKEIDGITVVFFTQSCDGKILYLSLVYENVRFTIKRTNSEAKCYVIAERIFDGVDLLSHVSLYLIKDKLCLTEVGKKKPITKRLYKIGNINHDLTTVVFEYLDRYHEAIINWKTGSILDIKNIEYCKNLQSFLTTKTTHTKKETIMKKYLKDSTVYKFNVPGSVEIEVIDKNGKLYVLNTELKADTRTEDEVMKEIAIAELKAKMPADTPEWAKLMLAILEKQSN